MPFKSFSSIRFHRSCIKIWKHPFLFTPSYRLLFSVNIAHDHWFQNWKIDHWHWSTNVRDQKSKSEERMGGTGEAETTSWWAVESFFLFFFSIGMLCETYVGLLSLKFVWLEDICDLQKHVPLWCAKEGFHRHGAFSRVMYSCTSRCQSSCRRSM